MPVARRPVARALEPLVQQMVGDPLPFTLRAWDGSAVGPPDAPCTIVVHSPRALRRMLWAPGELGLARAYIAGDLSLEGPIESLLEVRDRLVDEPDHHLEVGLRGRDLARLALRFGRHVVGPPPDPPPEEARLPGRLHTRHRDARAVQHHYDVSDEFYRLLLGPSLTYSCGYWSEPGATLEQAQAAKYELICRKLGLREGQRLLDVGCGWGGMVLHAARHHGVHALGVTLSRDQQRVARQRVRDAGLEDRVEIRLQDVRDVADDPFDAVSSIGMFEHVGEDEAPQYFARLRGLLRPQGRLMNHAISRPSGRSAVDPRSFMGRYVFPDSALVEVGKVVSLAQQAGLEVRDVESLREHYARTLRAWSANLEAGWDEAVAEAGEGRARIWRLYLAGCAKAFDDGRVSVHQVLAVRADDRGRAGFPADRRDLLGQGSLGHAADHPDQPVLDLTDGAVHGNGSRAPTTGMASADQGGA